LLSQLPVEAPPDEPLAVNGKRKRAPRNGDVALADVLPEGFNLWGPDFFPKSDGSETGTQVRALCSIFCCMRLQSDAHKHFHLQYPQLHHINIS
jgi:hypothetical protein